MTILLELRCSSWKLNGFPTFKYKFLCLFLNFRC